jgi:hypothetical protein
MPGEKTTDPNPNPNPSVTITTDDETQARALHVVQIAGTNIHHFSDQPAPPPAQPFASTGQTLGGAADPSQVPSGNQLLAALRREREARQAPATQTAPVQTAAPSSSSATVTTSNDGPHEVSMGLTVGGRSRLASGAPDPGPPGGSRTSVNYLDRSGLEALLRRLAELRRQFLRQLLTLLRLYEITPLFHLDLVALDLERCQLQMQRLELDIALRIAAGGGPGDPPPGGSRTIQRDEERRPSLLLRLINPAHLRFLAAQANLLAAAPMLLAGQQQRSQQAAAFAALQNQLAGILPPQPTQNWQNLVQLHAQRQANFAQALQTFGVNPLPLQPTANWQQVVQLQAQRQANFAQAQQALNLHPVPAQPTQNWQNLVQLHAQRQANMNAALLHLHAHPPLPLLQPPPVLNLNHAPMAYGVPLQRQQHVLHGDHTGGQHMGPYNPAPHGALPNAITHHHFPGHNVSYFPMAWTAQDILSALTEAAEASYYLAYQQANGNWLHPPVWVTRRTITIRIVVVTRANHLGLQVWTGWPQ